MLVTERHSYQQASGPMAHSGEARVPTTRGGSVDEFPGGGAGGSSYTLTSTQLCHHVIVNISLAEPLKQDRSPRQKWAPKMSH